MYTLFNFRRTIDDGYANGIFEKLKALTHVNDPLLFSKKVVSLTSSESGKDYPLYSILDSKKFWLTQETKVENQYVQIDFFQNKVILEHIQIDTTHRDLFQSYTIYGINNGEESQEINQVSPNSSDYVDNNQHIIYNYTISNNKPWNSIKIKGNGKRAAQDYRFVIHRLELFGYFFTNNCRATGLKTKCISNIFIYIVPRFPIECKLCKLLKFCPLTNV